MMNQSIGISAGDYDGYIKEYSRGIGRARPAMIKHETELINLTDLGNPNAPLMIKRCHELINLQELEELLDPRDPRFKTRRFIDMRYWKSPLEKKLGVVG
jgi:hypothetical protein